MLAPLQLPSATTNPATANASSTLVTRRYWPMDTKEEENKSVWRHSLMKRYRATVVRCNSCHRKFHSIGNLTNHQQLYKH